MSDLGQLFTIQPQKGNLGPNDRPTQVQIVFHSKKEVKIEDKPVLQCHVIEPSLCEGGETIATIPIRLSVLSLFSKYNIVPPSIINFGPLMNSTRKTGNFTIENKGVLDFKFTICKQVRDFVITAKKGNSNIKSSRSRETDLSRQNAFMSTGRQSKHADSLQKDMNLIGQQPLKPLIVHSHFKCPSSPATFFLLLLMTKCMPNLKLDEKGPVIAVKGKSLLPYCHFELEDSDYITANRRNSDLRGPGGISLDPQTKVIEFTSVGVHVKNSSLCLIFFLLVLEWLPNKRLLPAALMMSTKPSGLLLTLLLLGQVIETDPEPTHMTVEEGSQELVLRVSANVDFAQYKMDADAVHFRDTLLFQTRVFTVELSNTGNVQLEYSWKVVMEEGGKAVNFATEPLSTSPEGDPSRASTASIKAQSSRPFSQLASLLESLSSYIFPVVTRPPFSMEPSSGKIPPGKSQSLQVKFSPQEIGEFEGRLLCR
ncbi:PREDICTED: hydrocephalus-inducing protein-like [Thamnophis sirtalis]|uniref:Hydrocephalus-inducing protein-like n=1 Tax=Thamnophis sirtalis TaxID=35019 RepID=A0A6I9YBZ1_9SAUR|nr:PREDICTED: hydrocephalus-inducing protein-like [Thamnophis sirtalis]